MMFRLITFIVLSIGAALLSRNSLTNTSSHGFYRFFAFECILGMTLLNVNLWFEDPFSWPHLISWFFLLLSVIVVMAGFSALRRYGNPVGGVDETTQLVTRGIYKYIRHPLYLSLFSFSLGVFFKNPGFLNGLIGFITALFLLKTAKVEEKLSEEKFGDDYVEYKSKTKLLIPFLF
jgi:protein-S-isoprenylcysteine O-methyltransferase Ste14